MKDSVLTHGQSFWKQLQKVLYVHVPTRLLMQQYPRKQAVIILKVLKKYLPHVLYFIATEKRERSLSKISLKCEQIYK